jgi:hypothetical protein
MIRCAQNSKRTRVGTSTHTKVWADAFRDPEYMEWLRDVDFPWSTSVYHEALEHAQLGAVRWMHTQGYRGDAATLCGVIECGLHDIAHHMIMAACPLSIRACREAARIGSLDLVKQMCEHGCPLDASVLCAAVESGDVDTMAHLRACECPWDPSVCRTTADWICCNGCERTGARGMPTVRHKLFLLPPAHARLELLARLRGVVVRKLAQLLLGGYNSAAKVRQCVRR